MSAQVWPYHRAECDTCEWRGPAHLSPVAAADDARMHDKAHAQVAALEQEMVERFGVG